MRGELATLGRTVTEQQRNWVGGRFVTQHADRTLATNGSKFRRAQDGSVTTIANRVVETRAADGAMGKPIGPWVIPFRRAGPFERNTVDATAAGEH